MFNVEDDALNEIADLRRQVEHLKSEIELITAPPEAVGNVVLDLRRQLEECRERYKTKRIDELERQLEEAKEAEKCAYENIESTLDLLRRDCEKLNVQLAEARAEIERLQGELERIAGIKLETRKVIIARAALRREG